MRDANSNNPDDSTYWPLNMPARETTRKVQQMLAEGFTWARIEYATGVTQNRIGYIKRDPRAWDTHDDEVAIERALAGDHTVLPALTLYERARVRDALTERLQREPWDKESYQEEPHWLTILAGHWGVDSGRLRGRINRRLQRRAAAA